MSGIDWGIQPTFNQVEVIVIGPGYGECTCVHYGNGEWLVIDSCISPNTKVPAAIEYFKALKVDIATQVKFLLVTHWHDDHTAGLSDCFDAFTQAQLVVSSVLSKKEFIEFVTIFDYNPTAIVGSKVSEIRKLFTSTALQKRRPRRASQGTVIVNKGGLIPVCITALSPSDRAQDEFLSRIVAQTPKGRQSKITAPDILPNDASVAVWIEIAGRSILLGADLEEHGHQDRGWSAVLNANNCPLGHADFFKVPHHGSENGHHPQVWTDFLVPGSIAAITPWSRNKGLPKLTDCRRINSITPAAFLTSKTFPNRLVQRSKVIGSALREARIKVRSINSGFGAIRLRSSPQDPSSTWCIELFGDACNADKIFS